MVAMSFSLPNAVNRGMGFWKMNLTLLEDDAFKADVAAFRADWQQEKRHYTDSSIWGDKRNK